MNRYPLACVVVSMPILLAGCATPGSSLSKPDLSKLAVGMSKDEVIAQLGRPHQVSQQGSTEYLTYNFDHPFDGRPAIVASYFVRLVDGKVESFGERGDFDSTRDPTVRVVTETSGKAPCDLYTELRKLEELRKDGVLSEGEFEAQKKKLLERCE